MPSNPALSHQPNPSDHATAVVASLREQMHRDKEKLEQRLASGEINAEEFANQINELFNLLLQRASKALTPEDFKKVFGFRYSGEQVALVDPKVAAASAKLS